jgi:predicted kinase
VLIGLSGLPGTGKSALAEAIAGELGAVVFSVDPIEAAMLRSGVERSFASGLAAYAVASAIAEPALGRGQTVVIDAVNGVAEAKAWWPAYQSGGYRNE